MYTFFLFFGGRGNNFFNILEWQARLFHVSSVTMRDDGSFLMNCSIIVD